MLKFSKLTLSLMVCGILFMSSGQALAQSTEERFRDLFVTAGYATAFGAALGAATLSFKTNPENHLRFIAVGASLGFIGGSVLGSYVVFSPMFSFNDSNSESGPPQWLATKRPITIIPSFEIKNDGRMSVTGIHGQWTLAQF